MGGRLLLHDLCRGDVALSCWCVGFVCRKRAREGGEWMSGFVLGGRRISVGFWGWVDLI